MPAAQFEGGDLAEVVREAVFAQRISHVGVRFELDGAESPMPFVCDGRLLGQALGNVLKNAAEAIGTRRNKTGEPKEGLVRIQLKEGADAVQIAITDNGVGFPLQDRERLVEPYVTTRTKGTGLGLAIVRRVVEDHGGSLSLGDAPAPGPGAAVTFILPRNRNDLTPKDSE
jgi:two-component system nitrogen regulation sensor histidine kinase NtrY